MERCNTLRPNNSFVVMASFNYRTHKTAHTNTMAAHMDWYFITFSILNGSAQRVRIFSTKIKNLTNFNATCHFALLFGYFRKQCSIVGFIRSSIFCCKLFHDRLALRHIIKIDLTISKRQISDRTIIENFTFTSFRQN